MRIISQGQTRSVEFCDVSLLRRDETILARIAGQDMILGEYRTPARAKEIFRAINFEGANGITSMFEMPEE